jgi:hypothetical protein
VFVAEITLQDRAVRKINAQVCSFPYFWFQVIITSELGWIW